MPLALSGLLDGVFHSRGAFVFKVSGSKVFAVFHCLFLKKLQTLLRYWTYQKRVGYPVDVYVQFMVTKAPSETVTWPVCWTELLLVPPAAEKSAYVMSLS